ncbi:winged helix-turn-helix domain-containing protein [Leptolyngbya sp. NM2-A1]
MQYQIRPYLAQPYQSALKVLDCCNTEHPMTVEAIAQHTQLSQSSVRQVLKVLQAVELVTPDMISVREWRSQSLCK